MDAEAVAAIQGHGHDPGCRADDGQRAADTDHQGVESPLVSAQVGFGHQRGGLYRHVVHDPGDNPEQQVDRGRVEHLEQSGDVAEPADMVEAGHRGDDADEEQQGVPLDLL